jgi:hypothetical protein
VLWALSHLRLEHPWSSYAEVLLAGAVLVWWALGYRKTQEFFDWSQLTSASQTWVVAPL